MPSKDVLLPSPDSDLFDQLSIVKLKIKNLAGSPEFIDFSKQLDALTTIFFKHFSGVATLKTIALYEELHKINSELWFLETNIRKLP